MMSPIAVEKEYYRLLREKKKIETSLRFLLTKIGDITTGKELLGLLKLQLKGGPKDLSSRFNFYLYGQR